VRDVEAVHLRKIVVLHVGVLWDKNIKKQSIHLDVTIENVMNMKIGNVRSA